jgi:hypothetical protein
MHVQVIDLDPPAIGKPMSFSDFTLADVKQIFGLHVVETADLFAGVAPAPVNPALLATLQENLPLALAISTEKARSEMIIAPVLIEVRRQCDRKISLFSGSDFFVDAEKGLRGACDFLLCRSPEQLVIEAPVVAVVEAKNESIKQGIGQCIAVMVAARLFNQQKKNEVPSVYGVVTTGTNWKFLRLENEVVTIDLTEYFIKEVELIVGILLSMVRPAAGQG